MPDDDAWKQLYDLIEAYSQEWEVRPDLRVTALGTDRSVRLSIAYPRTGKDPIRRWHTAGNRNVSTMRELAHALLAACDFVEVSNPTWASTRV